MLSASFKGEILENEPLKKHTYYRIGGPARYVVTPKGEDDLRALAQFVREEGLAVFFMGKGSNVLASDEGFAGIVIKLTKMNEELTLGADGLWAGASVPISVLLKKCSEEGWAGLEFLTGVPGTVGGAVAMNAGTHLGETASKLIKLTVFSLKTATMRELSQADLKYSYRHNHFLNPDDIAYRALWSIQKADAASVTKLISETLQRRKATQPIDKPSCGSVFKNPAPGTHAWQVIDKLGLRGHRVGDAQFSEKHCNFIINLGNAKAQDVRALIELAKTRAKQELSTVLEEEVKYLGSF